MVLDGKLKQHKRSRRDSEDEEGGPKRKWKSDGHPFIDNEAIVTDDEDDDDYNNSDDDGFFVDTGREIPEEDERRIHHRRPLLQREDDDEELPPEEFQRIFEERYGRNRNIDEQDHDEEEVTYVEQQALLPSVGDPKLWMVKCAIGREKEVAACLMQKFIDKGSKLQITSVVALDHLKNYIYIEAEKEAHVREAVKGMHTIYPSKIFLVPIKEMTDVLSVKSKTINVFLDSWVRMKNGLYKEDLAQVVDIDSVQRRATVKLIPRIDLKALAHKLEGRDVPKKKTLTPAARLMNIEQVARGLNIRVERKRDQSTGEHFEKIEGMLFKDGFLYKKVALRSLSTQNIQPSVDELNEFSDPAENGGSDMSSMKALFVDRKKGHFMKGDRVIVVKGDIKNMKGAVVKVEDDTVHIRPNYEGLPIITVNDKDLCKYFEPGNKVKVVSGATEGATGMVVSVEGYVVNIVSDTTKELIRVFADNVVESSEVASGLARIGDELRDLVWLDQYLKTPPRVPQSPMRSATSGSLNFGGRHRSGRGTGSIIGTTVKIRLGHHKGCKGRVVDMKGPMVRVELESQMKVVAVDRSYISDNINYTPLKETSRYGMGSETPMHPSRTPLHPYMTPMRDSGATPIHCGMRTPMRDRAWNPFTPMSPLSNSPESR